MSENNRRHERHDFQIDVNLTLVDHEPQIMHTRDISIGGMYIGTTSSDFPLGEMVHVQYKNPLDNEAETDADAIIVRVSNDGFGIAFIEMDAF